MSPTMFEGNEKNLDTMQGFNESKNNNDSDGDKDQEEYRRRADGRWFKASGNI